MKTKRFTLVEMLVVCVIILILAGLILPAVGRAMRKVAQTECAANLHTIYLDAVTYNMEQGHVRPVFTNHNDREGTVWYKNNNKFDKDITECTLGGQYEYAVDALARIDTGACGNSCDGSCVTPLGLESRTALIVASASCPSACDHAKTCPCKRAPVGYRPTSWCGCDRAEDRPDWFMECVGYPHDGQRNVIHVDGWAIAVKEFNG